MKANPGYPLHVSIFPSAEAADAAARGLLRAGYRRDQVAVLGRGRPVVRLLTRWGMLPEEAAPYADAAAGGQYLVAVESIVKSEFVGVFAACGGHGPDQTPPDESNRRAT